MAAAQEPTASAIARAFNKRLLKVQLLHQLHHQSAMELGEASRMTRATTDHPDSLAHLLRQLLERQSSSSSSGSMSGGSIASRDLSGLLEASVLRASLRSSSSSSSVSGSRAPSFLRS
jgi:hypothetical protein